MVETKKIGLALGSGSARGWSHVGVIQALTEAGIHIECVAGTSVGALVGAVYAAGKIDTLQDTILQLDWKRIISFFDVVLPKSGLIDGKRVADFVREHVREQRIEDLPVPFRAVCTDLTTGREVSIRDGSIIKAVRASISVPGIFTPVRKDGTLLADGGLVNPVPVSTARQMGADFVIAVDLNHGIVREKGIGASQPATSIAATEVAQPATPSGRIRQMLNALKKRVDMSDATAVAQARRWKANGPTSNIFDVLMTSINIMETQITESRLQIDPPDLLIRPNLGHIRFLEFHRAEEAIAEGYRETKARVAALFSKGGPFDAS